MHARLNILDIHRKINQKQEKKSVCYEKVLDICQKRIVTLAEREKTCCMFEFPEYIPGYPLFDLNTCMEYCKRSLVASGFWVDYYFPNKFYITWDFQEIKDRKNEAKKQIPLSALSSLAVNTSQTPNQSRNVQPLQTQYKQTNTPQITQQPLAPQLYDNSNTYPNTHNNLNTSQMQNNKQLQYMQNIPSELQQKMMTPLPLAPPKYDPYDVNVVNVGTPSTQTHNMSKPINNTFFPKNPMEYKPSPTWNTNQQSSNIKDMMGMLTSSIGNQHKNIFDYKPSGKLSLHL